MPIIVHYAGVQPDVVKGENWKQLDEATARLGQIYLSDLGDGHRIIVNKAAWVKVDEVSQEKWDADIALQKKTAEDQAKARDKKAADEKAAKDLAAIEARRFKNRVKRFLHIRQQMPTSQADRRIHGQEVRQEAP